MNRYFIHAEPCPCPKCKDVTYYVFDNAFDIPFTIGEFEKESDAKEYIEIRISQDKVNV